MLLVEFPYPSGNLHIGHWYAFAVPDISVRFLRMNGRNVLYPIGFDAFGLPAENAAIKNKINPRDWTKKNIMYMTKQLKSMGASFDWSRTVSTIEPEYYKWTQWMFLKMFEKGLAYRAKTMVNWCPKDKTVLANEQVVDGCCERCDSSVIKKELEQWMFRITDYAERLINDMQGLNWPETTKLAQKNWIGRSEGVLIDFKIQDTGYKIQVFTTRSDTLFGATYMVLGPEHPLLKNNELGIMNYGKVVEYIKKAKVKNYEERIAEGKEKTGVELKGVKAINPANKEEISVWVADYVLGHVGTGAIMAVPAHDSRDFEFAKKYNLPICHVVAPIFVDYTNPPRDGASTIKRKTVQCIVKHWNENKYLCLKWKKYDWQTFIIGGVEEGEDMAGAGMREIREETGYMDIRFVKQLGPPVYAKYFAAHKSENRLSEVYGLCFELKSDKKLPVSTKETETHDAVWIEREKVKDFVRGAEIPELLVRLEGKERAYIDGGILIESGEFSGMDSENAKWEIAKFVRGERKVNYRLHDWVISRQRYWGTPIPMVNCRKCGWQPVSEENLPVKLPLLKNFMPTDDGRSPLARAEKWAGAKCPKCNGPAERETDTMDTFVDSSWYFIRYVDPKNFQKFASEEKMKLWLPVPLYIGGAEHNTMHLLYSRFFIKVLYDLNFVDFSEPFTGRKNHGIILGPDFQKMSKSRGNVIDPDKEVVKYGADTVRMYLAFMGPYDQGGPWNSGGINGIYRFLNRVYSFVNYKSQITNYKQIPNPKPKIRNDLERLLHKTIKKVGEDIESLRYNTAISSLMILLNEFEKNSEKVSIEYLKIFLKLLAPFAPHLSEELYQQFFGSPESQIPNPKQIQNSKIQNIKQLNSIHFEKWPEYDQKLIQENIFELVVQINGKVRDSIEVTVEISEKDAAEIVLSREKVKKYLENKPVKKVIYIPGRLINFVL